MKTKFVGSALAGLVMLSSASMASAESYTFSGNVTSTFDATLFSVGTAFTGEFGFDSAAVDLDYGSQNIGRFDPNFFINLSISGMTFARAVPNSGETITVWNDVNGRDRLDVSVFRSIAVAPPVVNRSLHTLRIACNI